MQKSLNFSVIIELVSKDFYNLFQFIYSWADVENSRAESYECDVKAVLTWEASQVNVSRNAGTDVQVRAQTEWGQPVRILEKNQTKLLCQKADDMGTLWQIFQQMNKRCIRIVEIFSKNAGLEGNIPHMCDKRILEFYLQ